MKRNRILYLLVTISIIVIGVVYKKFSANVPDILDNIIGDSLWALMVFFGFGFLLNKLDTKCLALVSVIFCFGIEFSQLYHTAWIDSIRSTTVGRLILGTTFVLWDLPCYLAGIIIGAVAEIIICDYSMKHQK